MKRNIGKRVFREVSLTLLIFIVGAFILGFVFRLGINDVINDEQIHFFNMALFFSIFIYDIEGKIFMKFNFKALYDFLEKIVYAIIFSLLFLTIPNEVFSSYSFLNYFSFFMYIIVISTIVKLIRGVNKDIKKGE